VLTAFTSRLLAALHCSEHLMIRQIVHRSSNGSPITLYAFSAITTLRYESLTVAARAGRIIPSSSDRCHHHKLPALTSFRSEHAFRRHHAIALRRFGTITLAGLLQISNPFVFGAELQTVGINVRVRASTVKDSRILDLSSGSFTPKL
jgi:hypothetical protein